MQGKELEMYQLPNYKLILDPTKLANALWITEEQAINEFKDGRVVSRFSEYWASRLYDFIKCENSNEAGYDGFIKHKLLGKIKIGVRSLTERGIKFQKSVYIGAGRKCDDEKLLESIEAVDFEIVVDTTEALTFTLMPVKTDILKSLVKDKLFGCSGLTKNKFYELVFKVKSTDEIKFTKIDAFSDFWSRYVNGQII